MMNLFIFNIGREAVSCQHCKGEFLNFCTTTFSFCNYYVILWFVYNLMRVYLCFFKYIYIYIKFNFFHYFCDGLCLTVLGFGRYGYVFAYHLGDQIYVAFFILCTGLDIFFFSIFTCLLHNVYCNSTNYCSSV